jgi:hypothetical protein
MDKGRDQLEILWDNILSRQPALITAAFASLNPSDQQAVLLHLQRMVSEDGWQLEQRLSAQSAIEALTAHPDQDQ